ncbi:RNA metabolism protein [Lithospermum erythrorhizon]|uniref:RNA metabolism protein n=1 Tax=Lithospermum erythrorhizon TaxID=34254 RepID=A0AAV3PRL2_LITER
MCGTENSPGQNNVLEDRFKAVGSSGVESGAKLQVSNLSDGVSNEDIRELFSEIGELVRYGIHYDKNGSPCGSAEVVYARRSDAFQAVNKYNNTQFHGKPMKIENLGSIVMAHVASRLNITGGANGRRSVLKTPRPRYLRNIDILDHGAGSLEHGRTCGVHIRRRGGRGRVHGGRGERPEEKSAKELGKELENDQAGTTQIEVQEEQKTV